ncbi:hypothetical protein LXA43DRAFT_1102279 [Ganoderma leucocontextum]|nr:hypothetical protein LXA43DRAFT_1102279 [Ganoderma leucocontextum]
MRTQGYILARCVDAFVLPAAVISAGTGHSYPDLEILDEEKSRLQSAWAELLRLCPSFESSLDGLDLQGYMNMSIAVFSLLSDNSDPHSFFFWLADDLEAANVRLNPYKKTQRGFNNVVTGCYLCPIFLDYGDKAGREALVHGIPVTTTAGMETFLFDVKNYDPTAPSKTFLRGPLIVSFEGAGCGEHDEAGRRAIKEQVSTKLPDVASVIADLERRVEDLETVKQTQLVEIESLQQAPPGVPRPRSYGAHAN